MKQRLRLGPGAGALALVLAAHAQAPAPAPALRDPTQPPLLGPVTLPHSMTPSEGLTVMVRDGKPHLVVGTRWYGVGDSVGHLRIDRITETEVWLHDGNALIKTPRFTGITRTAIGCASAPGAPVAAESASAAGGGTIHKKLLAPAPVPPTGAPNGPCDDTTR